VLRRVPGPEWDQHARVCVRFWKLRTRGWKGEAGTTKDIVARADKEFAGLGHKLGHVIAQQCKKNPGTPAQIVAELKKRMTDDGAGHLYAKYIAPRETEIKNALK
jgi:hypothetical protein